MYVNGALIEEQVRNPFRNRSGASCVDLLRSKDCICDGRVDTSGVKEAK
jgi:hypothetical protein